MHKIGAETSVTNGRIVSFEYYDKVIDSENQDYVFLVESTIRDEDEDNTEDGNKLRGSSDCQSEEKGTSNDHATDKPGSNKSSSNKNGENSGAKHIKECENKTLCCRINTAIELFKENQEEHFDTSSKDNLSSTSSQSSNSDDSSEETSE